MDGDIRKDGFDENGDDEDPTKSLTDGQNSVTFFNVVYTGLSDPATGMDIELKAVGSDGGTADDKEGTTFISVRDTQLEIIADPQEIVADGISTSTITVTFTDGDNDPIIGEAITVSTNKGILVNGGTESTTITMDTDGDGTVVLQLRSSTNTGLATITANCPGACLVSTNVLFEAGPVDAEESIVEATRRIQPMARMHLQ